MLNRIRGLDVGYFLTCIETTAVGSAGSISGMGRTRTAGGYLGTRTKIHAISHSNGEFRSLFLELPHNSSSLRPAADITGGHCYSEAKAGACITILAGPVDGNLFDGNLWCQRVTYFYSRKGGRLVYRMLRRTPAHVRLQQSVQRPRQII